MQFQKINKEVCVGVLTLTIHCVYSRFTITASRLHEKLLLCTQSYIDISTVLQ